MESHTEPRDEIVIVGPGRVGRSLAAAAVEAGLRVELIGREELAGRPSLSNRVVLLCVPDDAIASVAARIGQLTEAAPALRVGHVSGATTLDALAPGGARSRFSLHPLQTFPGPATDLSGCPAAIAGDDADALDATERLARALGMDPFRIAEEDRAVYHAAAAIASNFLVTLEQTATELLGGIAVEHPRRVLAPLVGRTLANWTEQGAAALTGPIARGDERTVATHRAALAERRPDLAGLYDELAARTRAIAADAGFPAAGSGEVRG